MQITQENKKKNTITIGVWSFFFVSLAYSVISLILYILTTGGWATLAVGLGALGFFGILMLVIFVSSVFKTAQQVTHVKVKKKYLFMLVAVQWITYLFNVSDCGDTPYGYIFIQRLLGGELCTPASSTLYFVPVFLVAIIVYGVVVLAILISMRSEKKDPVQKANNAHKTIGVFVVLSIVTGGVWLLIRVVLGFMLVPLYLFVPQIVAVVSSIGIVIMLVRYLAKRHVHAGTSLIISILVGGAVLFGVHYISKPIVLKIENNHNLQEIFTCLERPGYHPYFGEEYGKVSLDDCFYPPYPHYTFTKPVCDNGECTQKFTRDTPLLREIEKQCKVFPEDRFVNLNRDRNYNYYYNIFLNKDISFKDYCIIRYAEEYEIDSYDTRAMLDGELMQGRVAICSLLPTTRKVDVCLEHFIETVKTDHLGLGSVSKRDFNVVIKPLCDAMTHKKPEECYIGFERNTSN